MLTGRVQKPFISEEALLAALEDMVRQTPSQDTTNPLQFLTLVDIRLDDPTFPPVDNPRRFALGETLTQLIFQQYAYHREILQLGIEKRDITILNLEDAAVLFAYEIEKGTPELIGWSFLFYRYVRTELGISQQAYCKLGHIQERTLRRHEKRALSRLVNLLGKAEWDARKRQFEQYLISLIPIPQNMLIVDRKIELGLLRRQIAKNERQHILIIGAPGVGKSTLVATFIREVILSSDIDKLVWINSPATSEEIKLRLSQDLLPEKPHSSLDILLVAWRTFIILDNVEALQKDISGLIEILYQLRNAVVIMCSHQFISLPEMANITLGEMQPSDVAAIIKLEYQGSLSEFERHRDLVWELAGGNILAAKIISRHLQFFGHTIAAPTAFHLGALYDQVYAELDVPLRHSWLAFALLPSRYLAPQELQVIWEPLGNQQVLDDLVSRRLIELRQREDHVEYMLATSAYQFIVELYSSTPHVKAFLDTLLSNHRYEPHLDLTLSLSIIERLLSLNWLDLDLMRRRYWIDLAFKEGIREKHYAIWAVLLEPYGRTLDISTTHLAVAYATVMHHLSNWENAKAILDKVIAFTGEQGIFEIQATATLELIKILRLQGNYKEAKKLLERTEGFSNTHDPSLIEAIQLEAACLAIDTESLKRVGGLLEKFHSGMPYDLLRAEYFLRTEQIDKLHEICMMLLRNIADIGQLARVYVMIGNGYEKLGNSSLAYDEFYTALMLLEKDGTDEYAIARTKVNLAALAIKRKQYDEARFLLEEAEDIQIKLEDRVGLAATRRNLHLLDIDLFS